MRNFKKVLLIAVIFILFETVSAFLLEPVTYQHYLDLELKEDRKNGKEPDMVFLGNSSVQMAFVPSAVESELEEVSCVLNAATGSQMIWGSYYYLKDLLRRYDIKYAVVGIDYSTFSSQVPRVPKRDLVVMDRIRSLDTKADYIRSHLKPDEYLQLLKSYRYRKNINNIPDNLKLKLDGSYRRGVDIREGTYYQERGYVYSTGKGELETGIYGAMEWNVQDVSEEALGYLDKINGLCAENGVKLFLVVPPIAFTGIYNTGSYQTSYDFFRNYALERGIPFCDLNLMKDRIRLLPEAMLSDGEHMGGEGAVICSAWYGGVLEKMLSGEDVSSCFYASVEEMKQDIDGIVECDFETQPYGEGDDRMIRAYSIQEDGLIPEYELWVREEGSGWLKLQEYGENTECLLPAEYLDKKVTIRVNCRRKGGDAAWERQTERSREPGM